MLFSVLSSGNLIKIIENKLYSSLSSAKKQFNLLKPSKVINGINESKDRQKICSVLLQRRVVQPWECY